MSNFLVFLLGNYLLIEVVCFYDVIYFLNFVYSSKIFGMRGNIMKCTMYIFLFLSLSCLLRFYFLFTLFYYTLLTRENTIYFSKISSSFFLSHTPAQNVPILLILLKKIKYIRTLL